MKSILLWFAHVLSRALDPAEREAVFGDFVELGMTDRRALKGVLGLVLRRQFGFWTKWEPWFVLMAIVLPIGPLLGEQCNRLGLGFSPILTMWVQGISYRTGISSPALLAELCFQATALITWSWTSAFALGTLSRRTIWANGVLFLLLCIVFAVYRSGYSVRALWLIWWAWGPIVSTFLVVLLPAYWGLRKGAAKSSPTRPRRLLVLAGWTVIIGGLAFWTQGWYDAAFANWSRGAAALTLLQLAERVDV